ncbi:FAS1-like dehydratase domain-containing protein [Saccharopolyspora pogona]|uniref:FAS1-like dehydratase domain-containing protein n=1 Tax=Saccharopolyspora pogona TaxID=333966 RepID=UPI001685D2BA|nr:MaoC family dehydratase N-terminal domain-containing protein [Saccharopolyspora pogona]
MVDVVSFDVERGKVREFARSTFAVDPVYTDRGAAVARGHVDVVATPTYAVVSLHFRNQREWVAQLGLNIERVVVGSVRWTYRRPMVVGDVIVGTRRLVKDERKPGSGGDLRVLTLETDFVDATGQVVVTEENVVIERPST